MPQQLDDDNRLDDVHRTARGTATPAPVLAARTRASGEASGLDRTPYCGPPAVSWYRPVHDPRPCSPAALAAALDPGRWRLTLAGRLARRMPRHWPPTNLERRRPLTQIRAFGFLPRAQISYFPRERLRRPCGQQPDAHEDGARSSGLVAHDDCSVVQRLPGN
jgi:hypothetical protein